MPKLLCFKMDFYRVEYMKVTENRIIVVGLSGSGKMASLTWHSISFCLAGCSFFSLLASLIQTSTYWNVPEFGPGFTSFFCLFLFDFIWFCFKCHTSLQIQVWAVLELPALNSPTFLILLPGYLLEQSDLSKRQVLISSHEHLPSSVSSISANKRKSTEFLKF